MDWGLVDLELVELGLVDLGNSWGIYWRLAREVGRRGELVHLLGFWLLHARLKYNLLQNYGLTICMIHERQKEYRPSYTIATVERGQRSGITDHWNRAAEAEQSFEKTEQVWEETQGEVNQVMGSWIRPKENGTKGAWVAQNKELTQGSGPEVDSYRTRSEDGVSKVTWIGNCVGIGN